MPPVANTSGPALALYRRRSGGPLAWLGAATPAGVAEESNERVAWQSSDWLSFCGVLDPGDAL